MERTLKLPFRWHRYFYGHIGQSLAFFIPKGQRVLFLGDHFHHVLRFLEPKECVVVATSEKHVDAEFRENSGLNIRYHYSQFEAYEPAEKFDYVICFSAFGETGDLNKLLSNLHAAMDTETRLVVYQHNHLWMPLLKLGGLLRIVVTPLICST